MAANAPPVPNGRCFLCGQVGTAPVRTPTPEQSVIGTQPFQYQCEACGTYEIRSVICDEAKRATQQVLTSASDLENGVKPLEMESAALEVWNRTLETAERQRRLSGRASDAQARSTGPDKSACA